MPIELSKYLEMGNTKSAKAARKRKVERELREKEAKKPLIILEISKHGNYTDEEKEIIFQINEMVMSVDGTAEQWAGYDFDPFNYISTSVEIFNLTKVFNAGHDQSLPETFAQPNSYLLEFDRYSLSEICVRCTMYDDNDIPSKWAIMDGEEFSMSKKDGNFYLDTVPSKRDEDWFSEFRFDTAHEAERVYLSFHPA